MNTRNCHYLFVALVWIITSSIVANLDGAEIILTLNDQSSQNIDIPIVITQNDQGQTYISCPGSASQASPGSPDILWKVITVLLPPDVIAQSVQAELTKTTIDVINDCFNFVPALAPAYQDENGDEIIEWPVGRTIVNGRDVTAYQTDEFTPALQAKVTSIGQMRNYQLADVAFPLARYNPVAGQLDMLASANLIVTFERSGEIPAMTARYIQAEKAVRELAVNFETASVDYDSPAAPAGATAQDNSGYVIITTSSIVNSSSALSDFVVHKQGLYFDVQVITESDFGGGVGDIAAENIRAWLQANYLTANIEYVLLMGDPNPTSGVVPMKMTFPRNQPSINSVQDYPTDMYYSDLTGNWDLDGDGIFGEIQVDNGETSDYGTGGVDRNYEVIVGRIPYYGSTVDLDTILQRTMTYELQAEGIEWRHNCLLPMKPMDDSTFSWHLGENIKTNLLIPNSWGYYRLYDTEISSPPPSYEETPCSTTGVSNEWGANPYGLVVWQSQGSSTSASSVFSTSSTYMNRLNPDYPSFTFQACCSNAHPETIGNLAYTLLKKACVGTVGATRICYYLIGRTNYTNTYDSGGCAYQYVRNCIDRGMTAGQALATLRQELSFSSIITGWRHCYCFNLYGDPSLSFEPKVVVPMITPLSGVYSPSVSVTVYMPGSGWTIYYTTNGSDPEETDSVYTGPITITESTIFKVRAFKDDGSVYSAVATATYTIPPSTLYVDDDASTDPAPGNPDISDPLEDGSMEHPFDAIQKAIDISVSGVTVMVLPGTYTGTGNRVVYFNGKDIILRSVNPDDPQVVATTIIDCQNAGRGIVLSHGESPVARIYGLTFINGYTSSGGAGVYCVDSSPTIENCLFWNCYAGSHGGGIYMDGGAANIRHCLISGCHATYGGGVYMKNGATPVLDHCLLAENSALAGGGVCIVESNPDFVDHVSLVNNSASSYGGGAYLLSSSMSFSNSILWGNTAPTGASLYVTSLSTVTLDYCTVQNYASDAYIASGSTLNLGAGCHALDPLFANPAAGDYHLRPDSPCIDAGDPAAPFGLEPEPDGGRVNMGAFGNTPEATTRGGLILQAYEVVNRTRVGRTVFEYDVTVQLYNGGPDDAVEVQLELLAVSANVTVIDPLAIWSAIGAGQTLASDDTFTLRVERSEAIDPLLVSWQATYTVPATGQMAVQQFTTLLITEPSTIPGDITGDNNVNVEDLVHLAQYWLSNESSADIFPSPSGDGIVNLNDLAVIAQNWLQPTGE